MKILEQVYCDIVQSSLDIYPLQACGLVCAVGDVLVRHFPMRNVGSWPYGFQVDATEQAKILKEIAGSDRHTLGAIYHVHITSQAYPTAKDTLRHHYKNALCLIVSLLDESAPEVRGFRVDGEKIEEVKLEIIMEKTSVSQTLADFRSKIDAIDTRIIAALADRISINQKIADTKRENALPLYDPDREQILLSSRKIMAANLNLDEGFVGTVFRNILDHVVTSQGIKNKTAISATNVEEFRKV